VNWVVPEREFVRGAAVLCKELFFRPFGAGCFRGLKPRIISASIAALKRRSSTVLPASVVLDSSRPRGLKPKSKCLPNAGPKGLLHPLENPAGLETGGEGVRTVKVLGGSGIEMRGPGYDICLLAGLGFLG
jgi:hypothetical protein